MLNNTARISASFYNPNRNDMKTIMNDYLYGVSNDEIKDIVDKLKNNKYARLEINLRHPYNYEAVIPQTNKIYCIIHWQSKRAGHL